MDESSNVPGADCANFVSSGSGSKKSSRPRKEKKKRRMVPPTEPGALASLGPPMSEELDVETFAKTTASREASSTTPTKKERPNSLVQEIGATSSSETQIAPPAELRSLTFPKGSRKPYGGKKKRSAPAASMKAAESDEQPSSVRMVVEEIDRVCFYQEPEEVKPSTTAKQERNLNRRNSTRQTETDFSQIASPVPIADWDIEAPLAVVTAVLSSSETLQNDDDDVIAAMKRSAGDEETDDKWPRRAVSIIAVAATFSVIFVTIGIVVGVMKLINRESPTPVPTPQPTFSTILAPVFSPTFFPTESPIPVPTVPPVSSPSRLITSEPTYGTAPPSGYESCGICGEDQEVGDPNGIIDIPNGEDYSCGAIDSVCQAGGCPPELCEGFNTFSEMFVDCQCVNLSQ